MRNEWTTAVLGWQNRRDLWKCTHQCDETQGNNSAQAISTKMVFFGCRKIDNKRRRKQRRGQARRSWCKNVCPLLCFLLLLLSAYLLEAPEEDSFCRNRLCTIVSLDFVALVSTFPEISSIMEAWITALPYYTELVSKQRGCYRFNQEIIAGTVKARMPN